MDYSTNTQESFQDQQMSEIQIMGMQQFDLTSEDVQAINFTEDTLNGMNRLLRENRVHTPQEAFAALRGLNQTQIQGIIAHEMSREEVLDARFGTHTLLGIDTLIEQNRAETLSQASVMLRGLNPHQVEGLVSFNLRPEEVRIDNYGAHTNDAINRLSGFRRVRNFQRGLQMVAGFNSEQTRGMVDFGLTREQVQTPNFGRHTLDGMQELLENRRVTEHREGFLMLRELNPSQVEGITFYQLRRNHVVAPNFGEHTLRGIMSLRLNSAENLSFRQAYHRIQHLNRIQTEGVARFGLGREQVEDTRFTAHILNTMYALGRLNPGADGATIHTYAMQMPEYQIRAIAAHNFTPQQLGIAAQANQFVQLDSDNIEILSGSTIETIVHLMEDDMNREQALDNANNLNITQKIGMLEMGLTIDQVKSPLFKDAEKTLNDLMQELSSGEGEFEFPLLPEDQERARELMARMILEDAVVSAQSVVSEMPGDAALRNEDNNLLEPGGSLDENDINEFLKYALPRDFLGILDGLGIAIEKEEEKNIVEKAKETEEIENEILQAMTAITGVASRPQNEESDQYPEETEQAFSLSAFTVPSSPGTGLFANRKRTDSSDSSADGKQLAKTSKQDQKPSPRSKGKSYKR